MSHLPHDPLFIQREHEIRLLKASRGLGQSGPLLLDAISGTALFRTWRSMIITGAWATAITSINEATTHRVEVPTTLVTVLGVVLGLSLSYRVNSAYERYYQGRDSWAKIILGCRTWFTAAWITCPTELEDEQAANIQGTAQTRGIIEKRTMTQMALAYAVAIKHYLRGEDGILYDDLYDLICFLPTLYHPARPSMLSPVMTDEDGDLASPPLDDREKNGPGAAGAQYQALRVPDNGSNVQFTASPVKTTGSGPSPAQSPTMTTSGARPSLTVRPDLLPGRNPPQESFLELFPLRYFLSKSRRIDIERRRLRENAIIAGRLREGIRPDIPIEISRVMHSWAQSLSTRTEGKDGAALLDETRSRLISALDKMDEGLAMLEKIVSAPIPFSYTAHIWIVAWLYCILLPFQLCNTEQDFHWICIPAVMIVTFIVIGFAEIGSEIENPFGYDRNDLNLDFFVNDLIQGEMQDILAQTYPEPRDWIFSPDNKPFGRSNEGANQLQFLDMYDLQERAMGHDPNGKFRRRPKARFSVVPI